MKPGNQHYKMQRCQITQSLTLTLRDERTVQHICENLSTYLFVERFFCFIKKVF